MTESKQALKVTGCFPGRLNQVFLNLLVNSRQAIEGKGTITIETRMDGHDFVAVFSDTGKGIRREDLVKIFDPGFTTKGVGVGTGLGLSIVRAIARAHGGNVTAANSEGGGAVFRVSLPRGA